MKYFSEKLNKTFDTEQDCIDAEKAFDDAQTESSKLKKKMSKTIEKSREDAEAKYQIYCEARKQATAMLNQAREEANKIIAQAKEEANKLVSESYAAYEEAQQAKNKAVAEFNKEFGPYKTTLKVTDKDVEALLQPFTNWFFNIL